MGIRRTIACIVFAVCVACIAPTSTAAPASADLPPLSLQGQRLVLPKAHLGQDYLFILTIVDAGVPHFLPILASPANLVHFARVEDTLQLVEDARGKAFRPEMTPRILATFPIVDETSDALVFDFGQGRVGGLAPTDFAIRSSVTGTEWTSVEAAVGLQTLGGPVTATVRYTFRVPPETGFAPLPYDPNGPVRFFTVPHFLPGIATPQTYAAHWDMRKPIRFALSANTPTAYRQTIMDGALAWNAAFGRDVITVDVAPIGATPGDPRYNLIQWIDDDELGAAIGWSTKHPRTGETVYGLIIISSGWARLPWRHTQQINAADVAATIPLPGLESAPLCINDASEAPMDALSERLPTLDDATRQRLALAQLRTVVMHEVGHVLGLRHNFAASLDNAIDPAREAEDLQALVTDTRPPDAPLPSSSVMDYLPRQDDARMTTIGPYDRAAIAWAYGITPSTDTSAAFHACVDEETQRLADCQRRDHGGDPVDWWAERLRIGVAQYNEWILHNAFVPQGQINDFTPDWAHQQRIVSTIAKARIGIQSYANPAADIWYLAGRYPNERRADALHALQRLNNTPIIGEKLATAIAQLEAGRTTPGDYARWAEYTLGTVQKYLGALQAVVGR